MKAQPQPQPQPQPEAQIVVCPWCGTQVSAVRVPVEPPHTPRLLLHAHDCDGWVNMTRVVRR